MATARGRNKLDLFGFGINAAEDGYEIQDLAGDPVAVPTSADKLIRIDEIVQTDLQFQEDGTIRIPLDQDVDDATMWGALDALAIPPASASGAEVSERLYEDGITKNFGSSGSSQRKALVVSYGNYDDDESDIFIVVAAGHIAPTSGSKKYSATASTAPSFEFIGEILTITAFEAKALLDTAILTAPAAWAIAQSKGFKRGYQIVAV